MHLSPSSSTRAKESGNSSKRQIELLTVFACFRRALEADVNKFVSNAKTKELIKAAKKSMISFTALQMRECTLLTDTDRAQS